MTHCNIISLLFLQHFDMICYALRTFPLDILSAHLKHYSTKHTIFYPLFVITFHIRFVRFLSYLTSAAFSSKLVLSCMIQKTFLALLHDKLATKICWKIFGNSFESAVLINWILKTKLHVSKSQYFFPIWIQIVLIY